MKLLYTLLLLLAGLLISSHSVAQGSLAALDAKNGFQGAVFGSHITKHPNLDKLAIPLSTNQPLVELFDKDLYLRMAAYARNPPNGKIGDLRIREITYYFLKERLSRVDFEMSDDNGNELLKLYNNLYGKPIVYNKPYKTYVWKGNKVSLSMSFSYAYNDNLPFWFIRYISVPALSASKGNINKARANDL